MSDARRPVVFERVTVHERKSRLARWFGWASLASVVGPFLVDLVLEALRDFPGAAWLERQLVYIGAGFFFYLFLCPICALLSFILAKSTIRDWRELTRARLDSSGLLFQKDGREQHIPRSDITDAIVLCAPREGIEVHLVGGNVLSIHLPDEESARAAVDALGFSADERRVTIRLAVPVSMLAAGCFGLPLGLLVTLPLVLILEDLGVRSLALVALFPVDMVVLALLLGRALRPAEIVVGTDGVLVRRPFSTRYLPYSSFDRIDVHGNRLRFVSNENEIFLRLKGELELVLAAAHRIREARAKGEPGASQARLRELLNRKGRSFAEWRKALSGLLQGGTYRDATVTEDVLLAVLENPSEDRDRRLGAAMLLRVAAPEAAPRIRIAAETSADDELRAALERAAEEELDDATLERALRVTRGS